MTYLSSMTSGPFFKWIDYFPIVEFKEFLAGLANSPLSDMSLKIFSPTL